MKKIKIDVREPRVPRKLNWQNIGTKNRATLVAYTGIGDVRIEESRRPRINRWVVCKFPGCQEVKDFSSKDEAISWVEYELFRRISELLVSMATNERMTR